MSILEHQRSRISAALRSIIRAANGRDATQPEILARVQEYLNVPVPDGIGTGITLPQTLPLFRAKDYAPTSATDLLGGRDGRDISRAWAGIREDLDTTLNCISEIERKLALATSTTTKSGNLLGTNLDLLSSDAAAVLQQIQQVFAGSTPGTGTLTWQLAMQNLISPETTGIVMSSTIGTLPGTGQSNGTQGSYLATLKFISSSDPTLNSGQQNTAFIEQPYATGTAWNFQNPVTGNVYLTVQSNDLDPVSAFELQVSPGVTILAVRVNGSAISTQQLGSGGSLWIVPSVPISPNQPIELDFQGVEQTSKNPIGTVQGIKAHIFCVDTEGTFVWGPFDASGVGATFAATLSNVTSVTPNGTEIDFAVSTVSQDGPWNTVQTNGNSIVLASSGREELDLLGNVFQPDTQSLGFYAYPFGQATVGSLVGAQFSAGIQQAQVQAYSFNWLTTGEVAHTITQTDWTHPQGTVNTVAMGAGPVYTTDSAGQSFDTDLYAVQGTCLSRFISSQTTEPLDLTFIALRDKNNQFLLQPGYNYSFSFSFYLSGAAYLPNVPIGILNPGGPGLYGVPLTAFLNGQQVYQSSTTFSDPNELCSTPPPGTYATPQQSSWPPNCGRMSLALQSGWNTLQICCYIPSGNVNVDNNLNAFSGIVFGPSVFMDVAELSLLTGIQIVRGWPTPWTQLSEFDLRSNTPAGMTNCWAWVVDPTTSAINSILINHNPDLSETGSTLLDGIFTGQPRLHHISYLPQVSQQAPSALWVQATLSTTSPNTAPLLSGVQLQIN